MDAEIRAWRVNERERLKQERLRLSSNDRFLLTEAIARNLDEVLERLTCRILGFYWPIHGEFDLRSWAQRCGQRKKCNLGLPVVVQESAPLEYWRWESGAPMARGFWGIMVPERREPVVPDVIVAPLVGFSGLYRLGYGGGYFDRTLAIIQPRPLVVGVGTERCRIEGYIPQPHDIPMDVIVTEAAIYRV
jgi:5-formyltetrahydrofolate cyclo-ligase